jgi:selenocysteine-specific elongation factor
VILEGDELQPGGRSYVHFRLETPSAALPGDRFVIRSYSPAVTIGGGSILDPNPPRSRRTRAKLVEHLRILEQGRPTDRIERHLLAAGFAPITPEALRARSDLDAAIVAESLRELVENGRAIRVGTKDADGMLHAERVEALRADILSRLTDFHAKEPLKDGFAKEELRSKLPDQLPSGTFVWMLGRLTAAAQIAVERDKVRLAGHRPTLSAAEEEIKGKIAAAFRDAGLQPPAPEAVLSGLNAERKLGQAVFRRLVDDGILIRVGDELFLHAESHRAMRDGVVAYFGTHPTINVGAMKELFGLSRKYAIPYLEHLDASKITRRQGDERVPYK